MTVPGGVRVDETAAYVRLRVSSFHDTEDNAVRLAAAKHLLEGYLRRPIIIESAKAAASIRAPRLVYRSTRFGSAPTRPPTSDVAHATRGGKRGTRQRVSRRHSSQR